MTFRLSIADENKRHIKDMRAAIRLLKNSQNILAAIIVRSAPKMPKDLVSAFDRKAFGFGYRQIVRFSKTGLKIYWVGAMPLVSMSEFVKYKDKIEIPDSQIINQLQIPKGFAPPELIAAKRAHIKLRRLIKRN